MAPGTGDAPEGFEYVWEPDRGGYGAGPWRLATAEERATYGCRYTVGPGHRQCRRPPVAALRRNTRWWLYCEEHLYARRIRNGVVEHRVLRPVK